MNYGSICFVLMRANSRSLSGSAENYSGQLGRHVMGQQGRHGMGLDGSKWCR